MSLCKARHLVLNGETKILHAFLFDGGIIVASQLKLIVLLVRSHLLYRSSSLLLDLDKVVLREIVL